MTEKIFKEFIDLKREFEKIKKMGYVKGVTNNRNASGFTFEKLVKSTSGDICIPDFGNIELKVLRKYKLSNLNLFSSAPDGRHECGNHWIAENFGYKIMNDSLLENKKEFFCSFSGKNKKKTKNGYKFKASIDYIKCRIYLNIYDVANKLISANDIYWDFDTLEDKIIRKLSYLAIIDVNKKIINEDNYYAYTDMKCYKLKSISTFFNLIETGIIKINFNIGVYKNGNKKGKYYDHGTSFSILKKDINKLYNELNYI